MSKKKQEQEAKPEGTSGEAVQTMQELGAPAPIEAKKPKTTVRPNGAIRTDY